MSTKADVPREVQLMASSMLLKAAKKSIYTEPDTAVEQLQKAIKIHEQLGIDNQPESAPLFLAYGTALFEAFRTSDAADVFGQKMDVVPESEKAKLMGTDGENQDPNVMPTKAAAGSKPAATSAGAVRVLAAAACPACGSSSRKKRKGGCGRAVQAWTNKPMRTLPHACAPMLPCSRPFQGSSSCRQATCQGCFGRGQCRGRSSGR
jgi:hypothetical protein